MNESIKQEKQQFIIVTSSYIKMSNPSVETEYLVTAFPFTNTGMCSKYKIEQTVLSITLVILF